MINFSGDKTEFEKLFEEQGMKGYDKGPEGDKGDTHDRHITRSSSRKRKLHENREKFFPDLTLDLHGKTVPEACQELESFLDSARKGKFTQVLVICGKGTHSIAGQARLRPAIMQQLVQLKTNYKVKDFEIAQPQDGGYGALYVYL